MNSLACISTANWGPGPAGVLFGRPDLGGIGLVLAIVGSFLLANSILFRHPRALVREHFGKKPLHLRNIREYIFHRVQVTVGFAFLLSGFTLQLFGRYRPITPAPGGAPGEALFPTAWVGLVVVLAVVLLGLAWWWSLWAFRRYVHEYFMENPVDFDLDTNLAREVGELFGIVSYGDDTVQSYASRLRHRADLPTVEIRPHASSVPMRGAGISDADISEAEIAEAEISDAEVADSVGGMELEERLV